LKDSDDRALGAAVGAARAAGRLLLRHYRRGRLSVRHKSSRSDLVTQADRASERLIVCRLRAAFPAHDVVAEEEKHRRTRSPWRWYVDPLDGTVNFVHGFPVFSVSIALAFEGEVRVGVVHHPVFDETFTAARGGGARRNGRRIRVSKTRNLQDGFLVTGFPYFDGGRTDNLRNFTAFMTKTRAIPRRRSTCATRRAASSTATGSSRWGRGTSRRGCWSAGRRAAA
jgi:myo-inositol-1(or 4)-monophosphatase